MASPSELLKCVKCEAMICLCLCFAANHVTSSLLQCFASILLFCPLFFGRTLSFVVTSHCLLMSVVCVQLYVVVYI